jgi:hypothetical protein
MAILSGERSKGRIIARVFPEHVAARSTMCLAESNDMRNLSWNNFGCCDPWEIKSSCEKASRTCWCCAIERALVKSVARFSIASQAASDNGRMELMIETSISEREQQTGADT